ncbi:hypothetical protein GCM10017714_04650 [Curtobacterium pusillum]|uniref:Uncharacterized protein n=1 Tax=Curtobacterium pusillum TaxID=69373 RepID=A0AAW3T7X5_9MICO|nr:hypothetical protein [Curtobacterium pusillum]MBA8990713.1 hypothetical protein [Curtobacterium pusillum]NUU14006.1 hypothetical protein [Curtobacterium pusillum]GLK29728.1 hypothetical protein GCM10017610_00130 [Curtobacterium pusillum]
MSAGPRTEFGDLLLAEQDIVVVDTAICVCGHAQEAHEHYRRGSDCALCDCPKFRRKR